MPRDNKGRFLKEERDDTLNWSTVRYSPDKAVECREREILYKVYSALGFISKWFVLTIMVGAGTIFATIWLGFLVTICGYSIYYFIELVRLIIMFLTANPIYATILAWGFIVFWGTYFIANEKL